MKICEVVVDPASVGELTHSLPARYFHFTHDQGMVNSIVQNGFDLKKFGYTGKKFNMPDLTRHDPAGIYCQDAAEIHNSGYQPWLIFNLTGNPLGLVSEHHFFGDLAKAYGCIGNKLSGKLLRQGISVIRNVREFVILDPSIIRIIDWSEKTPE